MVLLVALSIGLLFKASDSIDEKLQEKIEGDYRIRRTVVQEMTASTSDSVPTARQVREEIDTRGFKEAVITVGYEPDGTFVAEHEVGALSGDKYPLYNVYYSASGDVQWVIYVCNGAYMASPVSYFEYGQPQILLTEDDYVTSYSNTQDKFTQSIPDEHEARVVKVESIDAQTLESFDIDSIGE